MYVDELKAEIERDFNTATAEFKAQKERLGVREAEDIR